MTDRELAGCAQVRRYYHSPDGFSAMELDSDGEYVLHSDYAALLAKYEALLSRAPSSEGDGRDGERLTQAQVAIMYAKYLDLNDGDEARAKTDLGTFMLGHNAIAAAAGGA